MSAQPSQDVFRALDFVRGAVSASQFIPMLKNLAFRDGQVQGGNGVVTLNAGVPSLASLNVCANAAAMVKAILACSSDDTQLDISLTDAGRLRVRTGAFRAFVPTVDAQDAFPWTALDDAGEPSFMHTRAAESAIDILPMLRALRPFVGQDATRPWALGVLVLNGRAYATNNVIMVEAPFIDLGPSPICIPTDAIDELLRIDAEPRRIVVHPHAITFLYSKTWWMRSVLSNLEWPLAHVKKFFDPKTWQTAYMPKRISDELIDAVSRLRAFLADSAAPLYILDGTLSTVFDAKDAGAAVDGLENVRAAFNGSMFRLILEHATHIDFAQYPEPVPFVGPVLRGIASVYKDANMQRVAAVHIQSATDKAAVAQSGKRTGTRQKQLSAKA